MDDTVTASNGTWGNFKKFLSRPYSDDMSAFDWFLFFGLMLAIAVLWRLILNHIKELL